MAEPQFLRGVLLHGVHHIALGHLTHPKFTEVEEPALMDLAVEMSANEYIEEALPPAVTCRAYSSVGIRPRQSTWDRYEILVRCLQSTGKRPRPSPGDEGSATVDDHRFLARGKAVPGAIAQAAILLERAVAESREERARKRVPKAERARGQEAGRSGSPLLLIPTRTSAAPARGPEERRPQAVPDRRPLAGDDRRRALRNHARPRSGDGLARRAGAVRRTHAVSGPHVVSTEPPFSRPHLRRAGAKLGATPLRERAPLGGHRHVAQHDEGGARRDRASARRPRRARSHHDRRVRRLLSPASTRSRARSKMSSGAVAPISVRSSKSRSSELMTSTASSTSLTARGHSRKSRRPSPRSGCSRSRTPSAAHGEKKRGCARRDDGESWLLDAIEIELEERAAVVADRMERVAVRRSRVSARAARARLPRRSGSPACSTRRTCCPSRSRRCFRCRVHT